MPSRRAPLIVGFFVVAASACVAPWDPPSGVVCEDGCSSTTTDPVMAAETRGAVHALALVVEAAAEAARSTSVPTNEVLLAELAAAPSAMLPSELADTLQLSRQTVTQALRRLADKGLVRKHAGPKADGRTVPYELTPSGRRLAAAPG